MGIQGLTLYHLKSHLQVNSRSPNNATLVFYFNHFNQETGSQILPFSPCRNTGSVKTSMDKLIPGVTKLVRNPIIDYCPRTLFIYHIYYIYITYLV